MGDYTARDGRRFPLTDPVELDSLPTVVGRERELRRIEAALMAPEPLHVLITGDPGMGKTSVALSVGERLGFRRKTWLFQCSDACSPEEVAVTPVPVGGDLRFITFRCSPLASSMVEGGLAVLDELPRLSGRARGALVSAADHRRCLPSSIAGETFAARPEWRMVATGSLPGGLAALEDYLAQRFVRVHLDPPGAEELERVVRARFPLPDPGRLLQLFWEQSRRAAGGPASPRRVLQVLSLAMSLARAAGRPVQGEDMEAAFDAAR